jgi:hypothetical protein
MFNAKPRMILQLKRDMLVAYTTNDEQAKLDFPLAVVRNLEVVDHAKLQEMVGQFADQYGLKGKKLTLVLDDSVVFQKVVPLGPNADAAALHADFQDKMPLEASVCRVQALKIKDQLVLLGTNGALYLYIVQALSAKGVKVLAVVPMALFAKGISRLTPEVAQRVIHNHHLARVANFLNLERL